MTELPKTFDPAEIEARWYARWEGEGLFRPDRPEAEPLTIVMPPPNVTGSLHIGHALDITLQDILIRHARLQGKDALWVVGTDHAGIATQMVVERQLNDAPAAAHRFQPRRVRRQGLGMEGRERRRDHPPAPPARRVAATGRTSASPWTRASRRAVLKVFVELYRAGPALSRQAPGQLGSGLRHRHLRSRGRDHGGAGQFLAPALSARGRRRLHLGRDDPARDDARRHGGRGPSRGRALSRRWSASKVRLPITGRLVPIIADEHADPDARLGRGEDHAGPRFQRFRGRQARRLQAGRDAQHARCARRRWSRPRTG